MPENPITPAIETDDNPFDIPAMADPGYAMIPVPHPNGLQLWGLPKLSLLAPEDN